MTLSDGLSLQLSFLALAWTSLSLLFGSYSKCFAVVATLIEEQSMFDSSQQIQSILHRPHLWLSTALYCNYFEVLSCWGHPQEQVWHRKSIENNECYGDKLHWQRMVVVMATILCKVMMLLCCSGQKASLNLPFLTSVFVLDFVFAGQVHLFGSSLGAYLGLKFAEYTTVNQRVHSVLSCNGFVDTAVFQKSRSASA